MTTKCNYCNKTFEVIQERDDHQNNIHKTEMFELQKITSSTIFWNTRYV